MRLLPRTDREDLYHVLWECSLYEELWLLDGIVREAMGDGGLSLLFEMRLFHQVSTAKYTFLMLQHKTAVAETHLFDF